MTSAGTLTEQLPEREWTVGFTLLYSAGGVFTAEPRPPHSMAGDDAQAKASLSAFIKSLGLRPQDTGDLNMAHWLEGAGLLSVGVGRNGIGDFNFSLGVNFG